MNFDEYQEMARSTAIYPEEAQTIYPALGIAGESGEIAELVKKAIRDDGGYINPDRTVKLRMEIGDVLWYLANLATDLGWSLDGIAIDNIAKLKSRQKRDVLHGDGDER